MRGAVAWLTAAASGAVFWAGANLVEGSQEPWDAESYWTLQLPLVALLCFLLGFSFPEKPWRWPLVVMLMQLPVMAAFTGKLLSPLMVVGISMLLLLSVPSVLAAWFGAFARRRAIGPAR